MGNGSEEQGIDGRMTEAEEKRFAMEPAIRSRATVV
jgi:hypothetical protein